MEHVTCDLCGADNYKSIYVERGFTVVECKVCGLCYVNPRFSLDTYTKNLDVDYGDLANPDYVDRTHEEETLQRYRMCKSAESAKYLAVVRKHIKEGSLLDVGCGGGFFCEYAAQHGFTVSGTEPSNDHVPDPQQMKWIQKLYKKRIDELPDCEGSFNVVTFWDSLEHVMNPTASLMAANKVLREGGYVVIKVPNYHWLRLKCRFSELLFKSSRLAKRRLYNNLGYFAPETHYYNYSDRTLVRYFFKTNFTPVGAYSIHTTTIGKPLPEFVKRVLFILSSLIYALSLHRLNFNVSLVYVARKNVQ